MASQVVSETVQHFTKPWKLLVSVCLTRMNKITRELNNVEKSYADLQSKVEKENAVYNDHEFLKMKLVQIDADKSLELSHKREKEVVEASRQLAGIEDSEEEWTNDLKKLVIAPRQLNSDNRRTANRELDKILHCAVKDQNLFQSKSTLFPYTQVESGETLRTASERLLSQYDLKNKALFFSNVPVGVLKMKYDENEERGAQFQGSKIFFLKAHLDKPVESEHGDVEWLTWDEFEQCTNKSYSENVKTFVS